VRSRGDFQNQAPYDLRGYVSERRNSPRPYPSAFRWSLLYGRSRKLRDKRSKTLSVCSACESLLGNRLGFCPTLALTFVWSAGLGLVVVAGC
jgi:hypothetical protein